MSVATNDQVSVLTRKDLAGFDKIATDLVLEMQLEGWQGYITSRGHAVMRHPDGSHQSITRSSNRAKSGTAMRARFESWKRRRAERERAEASAFGKFTTEEPASMPVPVVTMLEVKKHPDVGFFVDPDRAADDAATGGWVIVGYHEDPRAWAVFDASNYPVLKGHGSTTNEQGAWAALMLEHPWLFPAPEEAEPESTEDDEMASVFVCPEPGCGKQFDQKRKASVHNAAAHHRETISCPEPGCRWTGEKNTLKRHHDKEHDATMHACPFCGQEFVTRAGLTMHSSRKHKGQTPPEVTVSHTDARVAPQPEPDPSGASVVTHTENVLMEHLEHLPEGADAEAMVAAVRSIVAGPLVAELRRLREELVIVTKERDKLAGQAADFEARQALMREVMGV